MQPTGDRVRGVVVEGGREGIVEGWVEEVAEGAVEEFGSIGHSVQ